MKRLLLLLPLLCDAQLRLAPHATLAAPMSAGDTVIALSSCTGISYDAADPDHVAAHLGIEHEALRVAGVVSGNPGQPDPCTLRVRRAAGGTGAAAHAAGSAVVASNLAGVLGWISRQ